MRRLVEWTGWQRIRVPLAGGGEWHATDGALQSARDANMV
jgi:hypothetical protein